MKYEAYFKTFLTAIEKQLQKVLPPQQQFPPVLHEAMRYAVFTGGKRFRPVLTLASCEAAGGKWEDALIPAAAIELIHAYSLVHDDLPALDNDDFRRGQPTCHKRFGEAMAILAGDGLLNLAFHILSLPKPATRAIALLEEISTAAGTYGMIGGQVADMTASPNLSLPMIDYISTHKTGKLIKASSVSGGIVAGVSKKKLGYITKYGEFLGLAFQTVDDLQDGDGYLRIAKPEEMRQKVRDLISQAKDQIRQLGLKTKKLEALADFLLERMPKTNHVAMDR